MSLFTSALFLTIAIFQTVIAGSCNQDNCLRAMQHSPAAASAFCTPYLAATSQTATTGIPPFLSHCKSSTSRLSSACSCVVTAQSAVTTSALTAPLASISCPNTVTITQTSCGVTTTLTVPASTVQTTITCTSAGSASTVTSTTTSVSTFTTTVTTTATATSTCTVQIVGGNFESSSGSLAAFTVTENPATSVFVEILAPANEQFVTVPSGTPQFLFLNFELAPIPTTYTLSQPIAVCASTTSITLSATIVTQNSGGTVQFCVSPANCGAVQNIPTGSTFLGFSSQFSIQPGVPVTATMNLAYSGLGDPFFVAGVGSFTAAAL